jgi:arylsulfatase A
MKHSLVAFVVFGLTTAVTAQASEEGTRPNVVYILADDLGYGDLSVLNDESAWTTPHLDSLAGQGMLFTDTHSGSAVCTPTRYGILTGRYAWRTHLANSVLWGQSPPLIAADQQTIGQWLQSEGYATACFGKWHLGWDWTYEAEDPKSIDFSAPVKNGPHARGFGETFCHAGSLDMAPYVWVQNGKVTAAPDRVTENKDYQGFWRKGATGADFVHERVLPDVTERAVQFVRDRVDKPEPFFLYVPFPAPHTPILPLEEFRGKSGTNAYGDFVLQVDHSVGQILAALEETGLDKNTIVIFTSDNGCSPRARFAELETFGHDPSAGYRGFKADIYEGGHRVPFLVRWPGQVEAGTRSDSLVCLTDLMGTLAEIIGSPLADSSAPDSVSFLSALKQSEVTKERSSIVHHSINGSFAIREGKWKLIFCPGSGGWSEPAPKQARDLKLPALQLFNLKTDPSESNNIAEANPEICAHLRSLLVQTIEAGRSTPGKPQLNDREVAFERAK